MDDKIEVKYFPSPEKVKAWKDVLEFLQDYDYEFTVLDMENSPDKADACITIEVFSIDLFGESLKKFVEILENVSKIEFKNSGDDAIIMKIVVSGIWEAVQKDE